VTTAPHPHPHSLWLILPALITLSLFLSSCRVAALIDRGLQNISPYYNEPNLAKKARRRLRRAEDKDKELRRRSVMEALDSREQDLLPRE
jgi:hypothetical protein